MLEELKKQLTSYTFLGPKDIIQLISISRLKKVKKGEILIRSGEVNYNAIFVIKGLLRSYTINENGEEITMAFIPEKKHIASYKTILSNEPSIETVIALEDSWISVTHGQKFEKLVQSNKAIMYLQNKTLKEAFKFTLDKLVDHTVHSAEQRYYSFLEQFPKLQQRIAQKDLATYLGITPTSLSRLRARAAQHKK